MLRSARSPTGLSWTARVGIKPVLITLVEPGRRRRSGAPAGPPEFWRGRSCGGVLVVVLAYPVGPAVWFEDLDAIAGGVPGLFPPLLRAAGVGQAGVDGVVQVEPLAVPRRDDRVLGDLGVVAVRDRARGFRERRAGRQAGAIGPVEGEAAAGFRGDQIAALVDQQVVVFAEADQVVQVGAAAVAPELDVVQVDPPGLAAGEPAPARVPFPGGAAQRRVRPAAPAAKAGTGTSPRSGARPAHRSAPPAAPAAPGPDRRGLILLCRTCI